MAPSTSSEVSKAEAFAARVNRMRPSATLAAVLEAERQRAAGRDVVDFGVGEPDFPTPEHVKEAAIAALRQNFTRYTATGGIAALRQAICAAHGRDLGSDYQPAEAMATLGGKQALFNAVNVLVEEGDEVILPSPYWVSFWEQIRYAGGVPVPVATGGEAAQAPETFSLDPDRVAAAITPRTRMILLNSPANPSGAIYPPEVFRALLELCRRHDLWMLSDECYVKFAYDGTPYSVGSEHEYRDRVVIAGSLSKAYAMTGWRMGYALAPHPVIEAMTKLQGHATSNPVSFVQLAAVAALEGPQAPFEAMMAEYKRRRGQMVEQLRAIPGVRCSLPAGAFYAFPDVRGLLGRAGGPRTSAELAQRLQQEQAVVTMPGEAFGAEGFLRFSYACAPSVIDEGLGRFRAWCALLK